MTLKIPTLLPVESSCWQNVRDRLADDHEELIRTLQVARVSHDILPLITTLAEALRGLYYSQSNWPSANTGEKQRLLLLLEAMSHRDAILCIRKFRETLPRKLMLTRNIDAILEFYKQRLDQFYCGYEALFEDSTAAFRVNQKVLTRERPSMIMFLIGLISRFSGMMENDRQTTTKRESSFPFPWISLFDPEPSNEARRD